VAHGSRYGACVDVVVVTHQSADVIGDCLAALPEAFGGWSLRVAVVDNASVDDTVAVARSVAPDSTIVASDHNSGYAAGINVGVAALAGGGPLVVLNPDTRLRPGAGSSLVTGLDRPGVGITVPRLVGEDGQLHLSLRREPSVGRALGEAVLGGRRASRFAPLGEVVVDPVRYARPGPADWATGAVMAISRECLRSVGRWNESFLLFSEETEFALRARDLGWTLWYEPAATALHIGGSCATSPQLWRLLAWNRVDLYRRRRGRLPGMAFHGAVLLNEALRATDPVHRAAARGLLRSTRPSVTADATSPLVAAP
jgi:N-acetylglucosaminyl-diphospho-decaprenol L-rhamnosyltransferase